MSKEKTDPVQKQPFCETAERDALYKIIESRRDVRGQFTSDPIDEKALRRILGAAHHAPSVGFMQPWNFILIRATETKKLVKEAFLKANNKAVPLFPEQKRELYASLKLEGILEAPLNICVTCDRERSGSVVIGRTSIPEMDIYSSVCAVQNLWLAARAENIGVGWVSIFDDKELRKILELPKHVVPVAYLCLGHVTHFFAQPELEQVGWLPRLELDSLIYNEHWGAR